jgi:hypothetical protein
VPCDSLCQVVGRLRRFKLVKVRIEDDDGCPGFLVPERPETQTLSSGVRLLADQRFDDVSRGVTPPVPTGVAPVSMGFCGDIALPEGASDEPGLIPSL